MFVGPSKDFELGLGEEWGWSHGPPKGIELELVGDTPGLGRSWAVQLNQRPGGGPNHAELRAWEIGIKAEAGSLEGCVEQE